MKRSVLFLAGILSVALLSAQVKKTTKAAGTSIAKPQKAGYLFKNNNDSASYALGTRIAQNLKAQGFEKINLGMLQKAMGDVMQGKKPAIDEQVIDQCIGEYQKKSATEKASVAKKAGESFLAANGKRAGVITLPSGMQYEVIKTGTDTTKPTLADKVKCHYHGTLIDGTIFDSSIDRGQPVTFNLNAVIRGWQDALQLMTVGSKWKLYVPSNLAYGDAQAGPVIAPGSTLVFEVELLGIEK